MERDMMEMRSVGLMYERRWGSNTCTPHYLGTQKYVYCVGTCADADYNLV